MINLALLPLLVCTGSSGDVPSNLELETPPQGHYWDTEIGHGFAKHARSVALKLGRAFGTTSMGSVRSHDLWMTHLEGGYMLTGLLAPDRWYSGNFEGTGQIFFGIQDNPDYGYVAGSDLGLRYHFNTGSRIVPFIGGSVGIGPTDIGAPDLSGAFQFNQQGGAGARYFLSHDYAIGMEYSILHVSNGGMREPNDGITAHMITLSLSHLF